MNPRPDGPPAPWLLLRLFALLMEIANTSTGDECHQPDVDQERDVRDDRRDEAA